MKILKVDLANVIRDIETLQATTASLDTAQLTIVDSNSSTVMMSTTPLHTSSPKSLKEVADTLFYTDSKDCQADGYQSSHGRQSEALIEVYRNNVVPSWIINYSNQMLSNM